MDKNYSKLIDEEQVYYTRFFKNYIIGRFYKHEKFFQSRYLYHLRHVLYYREHCSKLNNILLYYHRMRLNHYQTITGLQLESHIDFGIKLYHLGWIIINGGGRIGKNLVIYPGVTIGQTAGNKDNVPTIGDNVCIYQNAMICGKIKIGNNVTILANSVVTHDIPDNTIIGGIPAKVIRINSNVQ